MRGFGIIAGIMMSILGGYAFFMEMDLFVRLGWMLGIVFILNSLVLLFPMIQEKRLEKIRAKREAEKPQPPITRKKKKKHEEEPEKRDYINNILGGISLVVGLLIFIAGIAKTLTGLALVYVVGSCVMFYGWIPLAKLTQKPEKEETQKPVRKKKKATSNAEKKGKNKTLIVCSVISLLLGALAICNNFIGGLNADRIVAYALVMQGINGVILTMNTYKKKAK